MQFGKLHYNLNAAVGTKAGVIESSSRDRLIYISACLIGLHVEVHVKNGSIYSGIFHSTNTEKDFGIVLKMARVMKDGSLREQKHTSGTVKIPQTVIIPSGELVQIIAKDVPLIGEESSNGHLHEKKQDLMIDSAISLSHFVEERELERWIPNDDDPQCPGLEDIFDGSHNRKWDQFETNEVLFGVRSTFNEDLYTTKLERGPQTRELEKEALRIAREIEGEEIDDLHLAEERGIDLNEDFGLDEESRFSAVYRGVDRGPCNRRENIQLGFCNEENFGRMLDTTARKQCGDISERKSCDTGPAFARCSQMDEASCQISAEIPAHNSDSLDWDRPPAFEGVLLGDCSSIDESRILETDVATLDGGDNFDEKMNKMVLNKIPVSAGIQSSSISLKAHSDRELLPSDAAAHPLFQDNKDHLAESSTLSVGIPVSTQPVSSNSRPGSSRSSTSDHMGGSSASSGPGLSTSSSVVSLASEKSKLNPFAKEFKLNPNARSFTPSSSLRPHAPGSEGSFYYAASVSAVPHVPGLPVGVGIGSPYGINQPVVYNPQAVQMQTPQVYMHPDGQYGQPMYFAPPRPVLYMSSYPPEMPYKGRDF